MNKKKLFFVFLQFIGSIFFVYIAFRNIDVRAIIKAFYTININYFLLYFFLTFLFLFIYVYRWHIINSLTGIEIPFNELFSIYLISAFFSNFLPGAVGGDLYRG